jgi:hypothetical protein
MARTKRLIVYLPVMIVSLVTLGLGIRVIPGTLLLEDIPIGKTYSLEKERGIVITVFNDSDVGYRYILRPERPSESGTRATGYFDFANPNWCWLDKETLEVLPYNEEKVRLYLRIPDSSYYYNRHWLLAVSVTPFEMLGDNASGTSIALGAYLLYRIETTPKENVSVRKNEDEIITIPSVVEFNDVSPGLTYKKSVTISSGLGNRIKINRLDPSSEVAKLTILLAPNYFRLNNPEWISYDTLVTLKNGAGNITLSLTIPKDKPIQTPLEEILMLASTDSDRKGFVRIRINPHQKGGEEK